MTGSPMSLAARGGTPIEEISRQNVDFGFLLQLHDNDADIMCSHSDGLC